MKINKPSFWDTKNLVYSILLIPLSIIYKILLILKERLQREKIQHTYYLRWKYLYWWNWKDTSAIFIANELQSKQKIQ